MIIFLVFFNGKKYIDKHIWIQGRFIVNFVVRTSVVKDN